ncbi:MAG: hypothetical protein MZU79_09305 [Anaerotruncus sp.]|nr:hypothetical protein [Anaerotruncus sp.]
MKLEPRRGRQGLHRCIVQAMAKKKGAAGKAKQSDLIYAAEEIKTDPAKK